jgi:uncharacterized protein with gpF-like domain
MQPFLFAGFKKGVEQGLKQGGGALAVTDVFTEAVQQALRERAFSHTTLVLGTTKDALEGILTKSFNEGQGVQELARNINNYFAVHSRTRSLTIARTELTGAINDGTHKTLVREGQTHRMWSTVIDGNERETHAHADGQIVGIHEPFQVGGESCMYPGDDVLSAGELINCRCTEVGADVPIDRVRELGQQFLRLHGALENTFVIQLRRAFDRQRRRILSHFPS